MKNFKFNYAFLATVISLILFVFQQIMYLVDPQNNIFSHLGMVILLLILNLIIMLGFLKIAIKQKLYNLKLSTLVVMITSVIIYILSYTILNEENFLLAYSFILISGLLLIWFGASLRSIKSYNKLINYLSLSYIAQGIFSITIVFLFLIPVLYIIILTLQLVFFNKLKNKYD